MTTLAMRNSRHLLRWIRQEVRNMEILRTFISTTTEKQAIQPEPAIQFEPVAIPEPEPEPIFRGNDSNFPCRSKHSQTGPEPVYDQIISGFQLYKHDKSVHFRHNGGVLPEMDIAYETWGELNEDRSNAVLITSGLSASSHARSHKDNENPGWWEKFVGPGCAVDTNKFFVICANHLGGCYGSTGPSSINPLTGKPYATTFPILCVEDLTRAQFHLLDYLKIDQLHASVGSSLGGMLSLMAGVLFPDRIKNVVTISSCAQSHPSSIAMRYLQRRTIMSDPNWNRGNYYDGKYPRTGMKLAREIATITYRSGPEWEQRFGRKKIDQLEAPSLCPNFMIENYLDYQGESFCMKFDPNSLLYISKAMDLFDVAEDYGSLHTGLSRIKCPVMVLGVQSDILFPIWQQREIARVLQECGNQAVTYYELNSIFGHDTFLLDLNGIGAAIKGFLETDLSIKGTASKHKKEKSFQ